MICCQLKCCCCCYCRRQFVDKKHFVSFERLISPIKKCWTRSIDLLLSGDLCASVSSKVLSKVPLPLLTAPPPTPYIHAALPWCCVCFCLCQAVNCLSENVNKIA